MNFTTLCYIEKENQYLMLHRVSKKKDGNKDKWIGVGGHFEEGESPEDCLLREVREETGLELVNYQFRGIVTFISDKWEDEYMCLYTADKYIGEVRMQGVRTYDEPRQKCCSQYPGRGLPDSGRKYVQTISGGL